MSVELHEGFPLREKPEPANCQPVADDKKWEIWKGLDSKPKPKPDNEVRSL